MNNSDSRKHEQFWQTLEERTRPAGPAWRQPEFPDSVNEMVAERARMNFSRKRFFQFMGAGAVMAGAACRRPTEQIVPAVIQPPEMVPGNPLYYSSTAPDGTGIIVKTREGRPIKIAGNPEHPLTEGGVSAYNVAATMDLYDPDRLRRPGFIKNGKFRRAGRRNFVVDAAKRKLAEGSYVLLTGPVEGPSQRKIINAFLAKYRGGRHVEMRPDPSLRQIADGQAASYGQRVIPSYRFDRAEYVVSIDGDFLGAMQAGPSAYLSNTFGKFRDVRTNKKLNRLVVFESMFSLTGSNADKRYSIRPGDQVLVALALAAQLVVENNVAGTARGFLAAYTPAKVAAALGHKEGLFKAGHFEEVIKTIAGELAAKRGKSLVVGASPLAAGKDGANLQVAVNLLNSILGNDGITVDHGAPVQYSTGASDEEVRKLLADMRRGALKTLIVAGANPVYHLPAAMDAAGAIAKVPYILSLNDRLDETARLGHATLPMSHFLESWGDAETVPGIHSVRQPVIRPLYDTKSLEDTLIELADGSLAGVSSFHDFVKNEWRRLGRGNFEDFWISALQAGYFIANRGSLSGTRGGRRFNEGSLRSLPAAPSAAPLKDNAKDLVLGLYYGVQVLDGAGANNAYRQELPDPVTKVVWENCVSVLPSTARKLGLKQGSLVKVKQGKRVIELPVHMQPGIHPGAALIALGYGRKAGGRICDDRGKNALDLLDSASSGTIAFSGAAVNLEDTGESHTLANTQKVYRNGFSTEDKAFFAPEGAPSAPFGSSGQVVGLGQYDRPIVREATLKDFQNPEFTKSPNKFLKPAELEYPGGVDPKDTVDLMTSWDYSGLRWHMAIDLTSCTGCGACVTSCNLENNIPMVGPGEVARGREMHWLRIDRYYRGSEEEPEVAHQPMLCQHCENAPCENVCPVAATTHNNEGLNVMTYNRCVGTRYCANNCPYKVRRFNWFENWHYLDGLNQVLDIRTKLLHTDGLSRPRFRTPQHLALNPDVTTRSRGVMEKCSFCVQRIASARQEMKARGEKRIRDGEVRTACQEVCPTNAIVFGDINDKQSEIHQLVRDADTRDKRGYQVLPFLGVKPSVTYLAKIRNKPS